MLDYTGPVAEDKMDGRRSLGRRVLAGMLRIESLMDSCSSWTDNCCQTWGKKGKEVVDEGSSRD